MGNNDLYLHIGRKSGKTITGEAIKREYERAIKEHEKRERLYAFLAAHGKPISDAGRFGKRSNHPLDAAPGAADDPHSIPAADVRPVVRGKWTLFGRRGIYGVMYECSACHAKYDGLTHFCPNCGADMRAEPPKEE